VVSEAAHTTSMVDTSAVSSFYVKAKPASTSPVQPLPLAALSPGPNKDPYTASVGVSYESEVYSDKEAFQSVLMDTEPQSGVSFATSWVTRENGLLVEPAPPPSVRSRTGCYYYRRSNVYPAVRHPWIRSISPSNWPSAPQPKSRMLSANLRGVTSSSLPPQLPQPQSFTDVTARGLSNIYASTTSPVLSYSVSADTTFPMRETEEMGRMMATVRRLRSAVTKFRCSDRFGKVVTHTFDFPVSYCEQLIGVNKSVLYWMRRKSGADIELVMKNNDDVYLNIFIEGSLSSSSS